jgi:hypothetical protein
VGAAGLAVEVTIHNIGIVTLRDLAVNLGFGKYPQGAHLSGKSLLESC